VFGAGGGGDIIKRCAPPLTDFDAGAPSKHARPSNRR